jgi:hypothetical protein
VVGSWFIGQWAGDGEGERAYLPMSHFVTTQLPHKQGLMAVVGWVGQVAPVIEVVVVVNSKLVPKKVC